MRDPLAVALPVALIGHEHPERLPLFEALCARLGARSPRAGARVHHISARAGRPLLLLYTSGDRKNLRSVARTCALADALLLVVSAEDGVRPQTLEHLMLAKGLGHSGVAVFINGAGKVEEQGWLELVEREVEEALHKLDLALVGLARGPALEDLIAVLERKLPAPPPRAGETLAWIDHVHHGRAGSAVSVRLERGALYPEQPLLLVSARPAAAKVLRLQEAERPIERAEAPGYFKVWLSGPAPSHIEAGDALSEPTSASLGGAMHATLTLGPAALGCRHKPIFIGHQSSIFLGLGEVSAKLVSIVDDELLMPGVQGAKVKLALAQPIAMEVGDRFVLRDGSDGVTAPGQRPSWGGLCGWGEVQEVLQS